MKIYQAINADICIAKISDELEDGWYPSTQAAFAAFELPPPVPKPEEKRKPGRPKKDR